MRMIKNTGLGIVLIAFSVLIATIFLNQFKITSEVIENVGMSQVQKNYFAASTEDILNQKFNSKISFINRLQESFISANKNIADNFSISQKDINGLVELSGNDNSLEYSTEYAVAIFEPY